MIKWVQPEVDSALAVGLLNDTHAAGGRVFALDLAYAEAANALWKQFIRRQITDTDVARQYRVLSRTPVVVKQARRLVPKAIGLATRYRVAVYDALFVALTVDLGIDGVTSDVPLYNAVHADHPQIHLLRNWPAPTP